MKRGRRVGRATLLGVSAASLLAACNPLMAARGSTEDHYTSWIGNSLPGGDAADLSSKWVQQNVDTIAVDGDGTVFTNSTWDENTAEAGVYRGGDMVGRLAQTHGWSRSGGSAIALDDRYAYLAMYQGPGDGQAQYLPDGAGRYSVRRYDKTSFQPAGFSGGFGPDSSMLPISKSTSITGLAVGDRELYVGTSDGTVRVFDTTTMTAVSSYSLDGPAGSMAWDGTDLWVIVGNTVERRDDDGTLRTRLAPSGSPSAIAVDKQGRLLVADGGPSSVVRRYRDGQLDATIGTPGGMLAGPKPGAPGPLRFSGLTGVGTDDAGNVYVGMSIDGDGANGPTTGSSVLRSFTPDLHLNWELLGLAFVDTASVAAENQGVLDVYTARDRFSVDLSKPPGQQWTWVAHTVDRFSNPNDPRLAKDFPAVAPEVVVLQGRRFLAVTGMYGGGITFFRFGGEVAVPSTVVNDGGGWAWDIDAQGTLWSSPENGPIRRRAFAGLDAQGNPRWAKATTSPIPAEFQSVQRLVYDSSTDTMYLAGFTTTNPNTDKSWGLVGKEIVRYDHWSTSRTSRWRAALPWDSNGSDERDKLHPKAMAVAGNLIITADTSARINMYSTTTGEPVGTLTPGTSVNRFSGWVDIPYGITAFSRTNGETIVLVEEDAAGKVLLYRVPPL